MLRGTRDQVAGGRDQADAEHDRRRPERDRESDAAPRHPGERDEAPQRGHAGTSSRRGRPRAVTTRSARAASSGRARSGASCARAAAARSPRRRVPRSRDRGSRSARRGRRAARREGRRGRALCAGARRPRAGDRLRRRPSRSRPAGRARKASAPASGGGLAHALVRRGRVAEPDVVGDRAPEERRISAASRRSARARPPGRSRRGRSRRRGSGRPSARKPQQERGNRALAAAALADERDRLARRELEVDRLQHRPGPARIRERDTPSSRIVASRGLRARRAPETTAGVCSISPSRRSATATSVGARVELRPRGSAAEGRARERARAP